MKSKIVYLIVNGDPTRLTRFFPCESELRHGSSFFSSSNRSADRDFTSGLTVIVNQKKVFKKILTVFVVTVTQVLII